ncbi:MAG: M48 family metallopeptidase [Alphaproteobacteria bacterium]|nr:M48 family metallopeptidase [Alphaproteobacteria bacterium]
MRLQGRYFDGTSLDPVEVQLVFDQGRLVVKNMDGQTMSAHPAQYIVLLYADRLGHRIDLGISGMKDLRLMIEGDGVRTKLGAHIPQVLGPVRNEGWASAAKVSAFLIGFFALLGLAAWQLERVLPVLVPDRYAADLGAELADSYKDFLGGTCSTPDGDAALAAMTKRLTQAYDTRIPLVVSVSDNDMVNAFALPGGQVVLFKGLITEAGSAEEVAGVLAHEIGHVKNRHPLRGLTRAMGLGIVASLISGSNVADLTQQLVSLGFNRTMEREADTEAVTILEGADVSLEPLAGFFERLASKGEKDLPDFVSFLSTHPMSGERAETLLSHVRAGDHLPILTDEEWSALQAMCGGDAAGQTSDE